MRKAFAIAAGLATFAFAAQAADLEAWHYEPERNHIGRIYHYERSNSDGTNSELVSVFRRSERELEVYKRRQLCTNAALVTAEMDWDTVSAVRIVGGSLLADARRRAFAFLDWDKDAGRANARIELPDQTLELTQRIETVPWHQFDFDFASLTVATPHLKDPEKPFRFGMALFWTDPETPSPFIWMGGVTATYETREERSDTMTLRYALQGPGLEGERRSVGTAGTLWLDAAEGHVVDAVLPVPNHAGYTDFRLRLLHVSDGGAAEWTALLKAHFNGC